MNNLKLRLPSFMLLLGFLLITSCKTVLAPAYDKAIVDGVIATSQKTMTFLAGISEGTSNTTFEFRENTYNELIGAFDALKLQARARPVPKKVAADKINKLLQAKGSDAVAGNYPSAFAFEKISETLVKMKEEDRENGIKPIAMQAFRGMIEIYLDQAITYESFLKR